MFINLRQNPKSALWNPYESCHFRQVTSKPMLINGKKRQEVALYLVIVQDTTMALQKKEKLCNILCTISAIT